MKELLGGVISFAFISAVFLSYFFGVYKIITDDHQYGTKDVIIGFVAPPYPMWAGAKEAYYILTTNSEERTFKSNCLDASEAIGMPKNSRLRFCECLTEQETEADLCKQKIFIN